MEDIQIFVMNMAFISWIAKNAYFIVSLHEMK